MEEKLAERLKALKLLIFDVDGVLTDGKIIYNDEGRETKAFDVKDGHGIKLLMRAGVEVALITARESRVVDHRASNLGIELVFQGRKEKLGAYEEIRLKRGLMPEEIGYMGDDIIDLPVMTRVGFSATVADAVEDVKQRAHFITRKTGGNGAAREVAELILKAQGKWEETLDRYLR